MKKFRVKVVETSFRVVVVEAEDEDTAFDVVEEKFSNGRLCISDEDFDNREIFVLGETDKEPDDGLEVRKCSHCGKPMDEGYLWYDEYYCCDECLNAHYTQEEKDRYMYCLEDGETIDGLTEEEKEERFNKYNDCFFWTDWDSIYFD